MLKARLRHRQLPHLRLRTFAERGRSRLSNLSTSQRESVEKQSHNLHYEPKKIERIFSLSTLDPVLTWMGQHLIPFSIFGFGAIGVAYMLTAVHPASIANWIVPDSYLPLLFFLALVCFGLLRLIFDRYVSILLSFLVVFMIFSKLHAIVWPNYFWIVMSVGMGILLTIALLSKFLLAKLQFSDILRHSKVKRHPVRRHRT